MQLKPLKIRTPKGLRLIGPGHPVFIVAEMSCNHLGSFARAKRIIDAAAKAGADAIKLQTYTADTITIDSDKKYFQIKVNDAWRGQTLYNLYQQAYTPWSWQPKLKKYAASKGLVAFSFPLDPTAVDFLEKIKVPLYKVGSFEVVDIPLLKRIGQTKKPVVISRGMSTLAELKQAIKTLRDNGTPSLAVFQCVSAYPAKPDQMNLTTIPDLSKRLKVVSGLSDHTLSPVPAIAAVALGASIIEKHLILSRKDGGPDAPFSIEPQEFKELVQAIRTTQAALGRPLYRATKSEKENIVFRKSLFVVKNIKQGQKLTPQNVRSIRPGHGLPPGCYDQVMGKTAKQDIERGIPLSWDLIKK